jgi:hypothetical protein
MYDYVYHGIPVTFETQGVLLRDGNRYIMVHPLVLNVGNGWVAGGFWDYC